MKTIFPRSALFAAALALMCGALSADRRAYAQSETPIVLGVVDVAHIGRESKAAKGLRATYEKQKKAFRADVTKKEKELRDQEQKLLAQKDQLSDADFQAKFAELQSKFQQANEAYQKKEAQIDANYNKALAQVQKTLVQIVQDIAKEHNLTLVLNRDLVLLSADSFDFTAEALKKLDEKMPSAKM